MSVHTYMLVYTCTYATVAGNINLTYIGYFGFHALFTVYLSRCYAVGDLPREGDTVQINYSPNSIYCIDILYSCYITTIAF